MGACEFVMSLMLGRVKMLLGDGLIPCPEMSGLISCCNLMRHIIGCFCCRWLHALCNPF